MSDQGAGLIHKIGLGTVQFGLSYGIANQHGQTQKDEVGKLLSLAKAKGIDLLDTANAYGESEQVIGTMADSSFKIVTKFLKTANAKEIDEQLGQSLSALKRVNLYGYMAHDAKALSTIDGLWNKLQELKAAGKVEKVGASYYDPHLLDQHLEQGMVPDIIQVPYNYIDQRFKAIMSQCKAMGTEVHTRSAFLQGLFFIPAHELSNHFEPLKPWLKHLRANLTTDALLAGYLLYTCLKQPFIDKVIIGVNHLSQLEMNMNSLDLDFGELSIESPPALDENILNPSQWP